MKILECVRLSRSYGEHAALKECSLTLEEGRMHVLLGPSGCGKSTLLEVLAGLQPCAQGTIRLHGEDVSAMPPQQRRMAMVFQTPACFPHMSVKENIMFASPAQDEKAEKKGQGDRDHAEDRSSARTTRIRAFRRRKAAYGDCPSTDEGRGHHPDG